MSIVEPGNPPRSKVLRWTVYYLAAGGGLAVVLSGIFPSAPFTALAIAVALAPLAITVWAPDTFVFLSRVKRGGPLRAMLNPVAGIPAVALFFRAVGMSLMDFGPSWTTAGACAAAFAVTSLLRRPIRTPIQLSIYGGLFGLLFGYGAATQADVRFDASAGVSYSATVMDMQESRSRRSTSYTVELSPWGPITSWNWQDVPYSLYQAVSAGDSLCIRLHPGALHERWFTIDLCAPSAAAAATVAPNPAPRT